MGKKITGDIKMRKKIFAILLVFILPIYIFCNDKYSESYILNFYIDVLFSKDRESMLNYTDKYKDFDLSDMDGIWKKKWYEGFEPESIKFYFDDNEIGIGEGHYFCYQNIEHKENNTIYYSGNESELNKQSDRYSAIDWSPVRKFNDFILIFKYEGDYLNIYFNEDIKSNLLATFCRVTQETYKEFESLVHYNLCDLSKVTWPRHADGSCDYDGSKKAVTVQTAKATTSTNVAQNKIMTVKENLKLRSGEATATQVLTVMAAGTKVKILELGKSETIDGISSNWVKVEVQKGAKDRDGNPIKAGTVGWCYGGYLK